MYRRSSSPLWRELSSARHRSVISSTANLDSESLAHIGSLALEYLIVTAIATMKLDVIMNNAGAILTISLVGLALTTIVLMTLPRLWLKEHWLENAMVMFGSWTGSTATGMMLLRIADPELETDCCWDL